MKPLLLLVMLAAVGLQDARAQAVYRCVEKGKPVSFQTSPCPATARIDRITEFTPEREPTWEEKQQQAARWARQQPQPSAPVGAAIQMPHTPSAIDECAQAKAGRDQWERTVGLRRTYEGLRIWNERVARACN